MQPILKCTWISKEDGIIYVEKLRDITKDDLTIEFVGVPETGGYSEGAPPTTVFHTLTAQIVVSFKQEVAIHLAESFGEEVVTDEEGKSFLLPLGRMLPEFLVHRKSLEVNVNLSDFHSFFSCFPLESQSNLNVVPTFRGIKTFEGKLEKVRKLSAEVNAALNAEGVKEKAADSVVVRVNQILDREIMNVDYRFKRWVDDLILHSKVDRDWVEENANDGVKAAKWKLDAAGEELRKAKADFNQAADEYTSQVRALLEEGMRWIKCEALNHYLDSIKDKKSAPITSTYRLARF